MLSFPSQRSVRSMWVNPCEWDHVNVGMAAVESLGIGNDKSHHQEAPRTSHGLGNTLLQWDVDITQYRTSFLTQIYCSNAQGSIPSFSELRVLYG